MEWILNIHPRSYERILNGDKTIESRIPDPSRKVDTNYDLMMEEEYIRFKLSDNKNIVDKKYPIMFVTHYDSIESMLNQESIHELFPYVNTIKEGIELYYMFSDYKEREQKYGIYAIGLGIPE
jgi:ASC-1-like (ASCH) protein